MNILLLNERTVVLVDTHVNDEPTAEQIAEFTVAAARQMRRMNLAPKAALRGGGQLGLGREDAPRAGAGAQADPERRSTADPATARSTVRSHCQHDLPPWSMSIQDRRGNRSHRPGVPAHADRTS